MGYVRAYKGNVSNAKVIKGGNTKSCRIVGMIPDLPLKAEFRAEMLEEVIGVAGLTARVEEYV